MWNFNLWLIGATAVEDKLQDGVKDTLGQFLVLSWVNLPSPKIVKTYPGASWKGSVNEII